MPEAALQRHPIEDWPCSARRVIPAAKHRLFYPKFRRLSKPSLACEQAWGKRFVSCRGAAALRRSQLGLTCARWQVLGAIVAAECPQPVAWLARDLGANRQNVQRIIYDLHKDGLVAFEPNPHHRRAASGRGYSLPLKGRPGTAN
jgi:hypothetical protein